MNEYGYRYARGRVVSVDASLGYGRVIDVGNGIHLTEHTKSPPHPTQVLGEEVFVSWRSAGEYPRKTFGKRIVYASAIEALSRWSHSSAYRREHARDSRRLPFRAEDAVIDSLVSVGIRAHKATAFQDERLGVDLWVFLQFRGRHDAWRWLPVDVTLKKPEGKDWIKKYLRALSRGVLPVHIPEKHLDGPSLLLEDFFVNLKKYGGSVSGWRERAHALNLEPYEPPSSEYVSA